MKEQPRVLIVDDDENTCRTLKLIFDKKGYAADIATTGQEALGRARERFYNLILLDIKLPDVEGTELISPLKDMCPDTNLVMVTAFASLESAVQALHEGAMAYVTKPLNMDEVLALAKQALEMQRLVMEKRRAEDALRKSEEKYRTILQSMNDLVFIIDKHDCYSQYYTSSEELLFVSPTEFMGRQVSEVLPSSVAERFVESFQKVRETEGSEVFDYLLEIDDQTYWFSAVLSLHEDGESIVQVVRNITRRKQAEEAMQESEKKYRLLAENTFDCIWQMDLNADFTYVNPAIFRVFGFTPEEWVGSSLSEHCSPEAMEFISDIMMETIRKGSNAIPETFETRMLRKDGKEIDVEITGNLILDKEGNPLRFQGTTRNITERKRAVKALAGSEREKSAILNGMKDLVVYFDNPDMKIVWANRAAAEDVNLSVNELIGAHCCKIWHQRDESLDTCPVVRVFKTGQPEEEETTSPDGRIWFVRGWPVKDDKERTIGVVKVSRNVTEQKRAEEALQESEEWFRTIYEESPIAINVFDHDGNLIHMNPACIDFAGVSSLEDLKDFNIFEDPNFPEDKKQQLRNGERVLFRSTIDWSKVKEAQLYNTNKSGVSYVETGASPLKYGADESLRGYMIQMVDITDRVLAEKEVRASEKRYRGLVERMSEVVFRLSVPDAEYEYMSPSISPLLGYPAEEFLDNPLLFLKVIHPDSMDYFMGAFGEMVENNVFSTIEYKIIDTSGNTKWVSQSNSPVYDDEGNLIAVEGICRDISDRKKAEEDMRTAAETAMLYLDLMGHDIRNHLQAIVMGTEILEELDIKPEIREMVDIVVESVEKSRNLIRKVQATRELLSVPLSSTPLREALEDCLQVLNETHEDVQIEVNLAVQQPTVIADKYLESLLMNILENAIFHNDKKPRRVWLDLREARGGYEVVIADNGPGISDDKKENLFDQSRRFGGVGVHQAFKIAQKYGGHISVQDRVLGNSSKGAEFRIWFPKSTA